MLKKLRSMFAGKPEAPARATNSPTPRNPVTMHWREDATWPIPDWEAIAQAEEAQWQDAERDAFWSAAASQWLERMAQEWDGGYAVRESREFFLLCAFAERDSRVFLDFCESVRKRILAYLPGLASTQGHGKHVVIVIDDQDEYYDYISHYYPEGGEYAMSSGVFLHAGYGHFVLWTGEVDAMQPVVAHELTHCLVAHLPLPVWVNEGITVNTEHRIFPHLAHPNAQKYFPHEMVARHAAFWNAQTIQEFWSGEAFHRPDEGSMLAYDLARKTTALAAREFDDFRAFALQASAEDGGRAAEPALGYPITNLVAAVLGEGEWEPKPEEWRTEGLQPA